jgi:leader peptidase (prepilin peptidase) / N-methyltransferase
VNALLALPPALRLVLLAAVGLAAGSLVNAGIYALAWFRRPISPWQRPHPDAPARCWSDFIPVIGWFGLARESAFHGRGFWIRPLLIELCCGIGLPALYHWELASKLAPLLAGVAAPVNSTLLHQFVSHAILIALMLVATFIDFDEKTIPDEITIPGTLIGLLLAAIWPDSHLTVARPMPPPATAMAYQPLHLTSTSEWPPWLDSGSGLALGLVLFTAWCVALIPALATLRRGWWKGIQFYFASIARASAWWKMLLLALLGSAAIAIVWHQDGASWQALLSSLGGMAFGGGLVWAVRIAGRIALHKEAMGFGDVTLLAMIGAFLGWQPCLMIFFLSPFTALVIAVVQVVLTGRRDIPYGPYLCASTLVIVVQWAWFWNQFSGIFTQMGWLLLSILVGCLVLMTALLMLWRMIERGIWPE